MKAAISAICLIAKRTIMIWPIWVFSVIVLIPFSIMLYIYVKHILTQCKRKMAKNIEKLATLGAFGRGFGRGFGAG